MLLVEGGQRLHWMWRTDWGSLAPPEDAQVLEQLAEDLQKWAQEWGAERFLLMIEEQASNILRISERRTISNSDATTALRRIFFENCSPERKP